MDLRFLSFGFRGSDFGNSGNSKPFALDIPIRTMALKITLNPEALRDLDIIIGFRLLKPSVGLLEVSEGYSLRNRATARQSKAHTGSSSP